jgi:butyrate kinase
VVPGISHKVKVAAIAAHLTSTEIGVYDGMDEIIHEVIRHAPSEISSFRTPSEQGSFRFSAVTEALAVRGYEIKDIDVIVTQIESHALPPGIYMVDDRLLGLLSGDVIDENRLRSGVFVAHLLSCHINDNFGVESLPLAVEPVIEDEILPEASLSGIRGVVRTPQYKSLSQRAGATFFAYYELHKGANEIRAVAVHLGKEIISVGAFDRGRMIDNNCIQDGEGPFSPMASGTLPLDALIDFSYSGKYDMDEIIAMITHKSGLAAYLDDVSLEYVSAEYRAGNRKVIFLVRALAYGVAREIGARAASLRGQVDGIVMVGPWVKFDELVELITAKVSWIAPVKIYAYEGEMLTLALTGEKAYMGDYKILLYGRDRADRG